MKAWLEQAWQATFFDWSYEETLKAKLLYLEYLGHSFGSRENEEAQRLAEHLESFGGEDRAMLFAGSVAVSAPQAAFGNAMLTPQASLVFPTVLAAIEQGHLGGKEFVAALMAGLEATYRMGDHPQAELVGALVGVANAFGLDEEGWGVLLGLMQRNLSELPTSSLQRGLLAHDIVLNGYLARDEWSGQAVEPLETPAEWMAAFERTADTGKPDLNHFLLATEVNADQTIAQFRERVAGKIPAPYVEYYIDAVMAYEDIAVVRFSFRR